MTYETFLVFNFIKKEMIISLWIRRIIELSNLKMSAYNLQLHLKCTSACLINLCLQKRSGKDISNITYIAPGIIIYLVINITFHCISYISMLWFYLKSINTL